VEPFFTRETAETLVRDLAGELQPRWAEEELVVRSPRWDPKRQETFSEELRVRPNRDGLYPLGDFGRAKRLALPLVEWEWKEVFPAWPDGALDGATIARLLDTPLPRSLSSKNRGPTLERIEDQAAIPDLIDGLRRAETQAARRTLGYILAYHDRAAEAAPALPVLAEHFLAASGEARRDAAGAIAALASRLGPRASLAASPGLEDVLAHAYAEEQEEAVRNELQQALGALGHHAVDNPFVADVIRLFQFLERDHDFPPPVTEEVAFSHIVRYRNDQVAVEVSYDWRERWLDVEVVKLIDGALPSPETGERVRPTSIADVTAASGLEAEAAALRSAPHLLRGDF
jgi:hypothetical protein